MDREGSSGRRQGYVMFTKVIFNPAEVSFFRRKSVFRDVCMQSCPALKFLVTLCPPHYIKFLLFFQTSDRGRPACGRLGRQTFLYNNDFRSSKNNFRGHDLSQGLEREPPSLSPHFLLSIV